MVRAMQAGFAPVGKKSTGEPTGESLHEDLPWTSEQLLVVHVVHMHSVHKVPSHLVTLKFWSGSLFHNVHSSPKETQVYRINP